MKNSPSASLFLVAVCATLLFPFASLPAQTISSSSSGAAELPELALGEQTEFPVVIDATAARGVKNLKAGETGAAAIYLPSNFDKTKPWPVFLVFSTTDGGGTNVGKIKMYQKAAEAKGWILLAADRPQDSESGLEGDAAALNSAAAMLTKAFPGFPAWPKVCGGSSGGGKRAGFMAPMLAKQSWNITGVYMSGTNANTLGQAFADQRPGSTFKKIKVFLSSGEKDNIASPDSIAAVESSLQNDGFKQTRLETHPGGHGLASEEVEKALEWFAEKSPGA